MRQISISEFNLRSFASPILLGNRVFIPIVKATSSQEIKDSVFANTKHVAFNYYDIMFGSKELYSSIFGRGLKDTFNIPDAVETYILTTEHDDIIKRILLKGDGFQKFKQNIMNFGADHFMGPDFWTYKDKMTNQQNEQIVNISLNFH